MGLLTLVVLSMHSLLFTWLIGAGSRFSAYKEWHSLYKGAMAQLDTFSEGLPFRSWRLGMPAPIMNDRAASFV